MKINKKGITRIVFVFRSFVLKIPKFTYSHDHFLQGCVSNWSERKFTKTFKNANFSGNMYKHIAPSLWCSWFGLIQIQVKCEPNPEPLSDSQKEFFEPLCGTDSKKENFGILNGRLVCLDYGL